MKKSLFLVPLALGLFACSNDNLVENPGQNPDASDGDLSYLSVNITNVASAGTRDGSNNNHPYEDGIAAEYKVNEVAFFFFDQDKVAVPVAEGGTNFYTEISMSEDQATSENDEGGNVTATTEAKLVLATGGSKTSTFYMAAIVNPSEALKDKYKLIKNYDDFKAMTDAQWLDNETDKHFQMSSSVYGKKTGNTTDPEGLVNITANIMPTESGAINNPAHIYVERLAAKASLLIDETHLIKVQDKPNIYKLELPEGSSLSSDYLSYDGTAIYVSLLGWNVTAVANKEFAVKNLYEGWFTSDASAPWDGWNTGTTNHRSFWAENPSNLTYNYGNFNYGKTISKFVAPNYSPDGTTYEGEANWTYMLENAVKLDESSNFNPINGEAATTTKIIVEAELCNEQGTALSFASYSNTKFPYSDDNKATLLKAMANQSHIYIKSNDDNGNDVYTSIDNSILRLVAYEDLDAAKEIADGVKIDNDFIYKDQTYYTFALVDAAKVLVENAVPRDTYYIGSGNSRKEITSIEEFNTQLIQYAGAAKIYNQGKTYYYFDIKHLNTGTNVTDPKKAVENWAQGYYGVVRNHWYESTITKIYGLGTPVFDPDKVIYPQTPKDEPWTYLAADIKVLSWHKVSNDNVELGK